MNMTPREPYYRECPKCGSDDIRLMNNEKQYEYCYECKHREDGVGQFLRGPGIHHSDNGEQRMFAYKSYFGDCCTVCGETKDLKVCGYTRHGRGIPFRVCRVHAKPDEIVSHRVVFNVKPRDASHFNRMEIAKERDLKTIERQRAIKKMGKKRPEIGKTGKTARKRAAKAAQNG